MPKRDEAAAPPRKRQRTQKQPASRKRGSLSDIVNLPTEIFTTITSYLLPLDILHLARSNRFFRDLLMTSSSRAIWLNSMKNVDGLPPCPRGMSEPQYVALLFTNVCSSCGTLSRSQVDEFLVVRLCAACKDDKLHEVPEQLHELIPYSTKSTGVRDLMGLHRFVGIARRGEVRAIQKQYNNLVDDDEDAFEDWVEQRKSIVASRCTFADKLGKFLNALEAQRGEEKKQLLEDREAQIREKLLALGWEEGDMKFNPYRDGAREWHEWVEMPKQPKPLTDRTWKNLYAKLEPFLEENREERLKRERFQLKVRRRYCLDKFLRSIQRQEPPLLKVKQRQLESETFASFYRPLAQRDVFPFFQDGLEWPFVQELDDEGPSVETFREGLEEHRDEMNAYISEWQEETRTYLADRLREEGLVYHALLQPPKNMEPNLFARLSDENKLLLRADSLFSVGQAYSTSVRPYTYDRALRAVYPSSPEYPTDHWEPGYDWFYDSDSDSDSDSEFPDLSTIHRHAEAQEVARDLLLDLGKPNASFLEMNQLHYTCMRCHDRKPRDWIEIIEHYLEQKRIIAKIKKNASTLAQEGCVYYDVHVPGEAPIVKFSKPKESIKVVVRKCNLCAHKLIAQAVITSKPNLYRHLREVHCVAQPKPGVHYRPPTSSGAWDEPGFGYDYEDEDDDDQIEEVEADNEPGKEGEEEEYLYGGESLDEEEDESSSESYGSDNSE